MDVAEAATEAGPDDDDRDVASGENVETRLVAVFIVALFWCLVRVVVVVVDG